MNKISLASLVSITHLPVNELTYMPMVINYSCIPPNLVYSSLNINLVHLNQMNSLFIIKYSYFLYSITHYSQISESHYYWILNSKNLKRGPITFYAKIISLPILLTFSKYTIYLLIIFKIYFIILFKAPKLITCNSKYFFIFVS